MAHARHIGVILPAPWLPREARLNLSAMVTRSVLVLNGVLVVLAVSGADSAPALLPGGHCNYSTEATRTAPGGWDVIQEHCKKLEGRHAIHIAAYGEGNDRRLTGKHETSSMNSFAW